MASANGTYIGTNAAAAGADFINYEVAGVAEFKVDKNGTSITGNGSGLTDITGTMSGMTAGQVPYATSATAVATSPDFAWNNATHGMTLNSTNAPAGDALQIANAPAATNASSLLTLGATNLAGASASRYLYWREPCCGGC